jgi:hypothetical protein
MGPKEPQPAWTPTEKQISQVEAWSAVRVPMEHMASLLGISKDTLERAIKKNDALRAALDIGRAKASANVRTTLYNMGVIDKDFQALRFWCQTQEGFKITERQELTGADGAPIATTQLTPEQRRQEIDRIMALRNIGLSEQEDQADE